MWKNRRLVRRRVEWGNMLSYTRKTENIRGFFISIIIESTGLIVIKNLFLYAPGC